ncbi:hypothetical protein OIO90_003761 [Microbotryomycetes sp. JL221]|nr:hypothetical protein OIO90_003761 [Microbotryomycetes sp. JL221]
MSASGAGDRRSYPRPTQVTMNGHPSSSSFEPSASSQLEAPSPHLTARNRRQNTRPSPEVDVWFGPPQQSSSLQPTPQVSFPVSGHTTPLTLSANNSPYFDAKASPSIDGSPLQLNNGKMYSSSSPAPGARLSPAALSWRQAVSDPRRRPRKQSIVSVQNCLLGGGALLALTVLYFVLARGSSSSSSGAVERMGREEHDIVASRSSVTAASRPANGRGKAVSFRDELSTDMKYLTSPPSGTLGEQIINFYHLTFLSRQLARIPLIPPFVTHDASGKPVSIAFSAMFDMPRFSQTTSVSAVDWTDIRPPGAGDDALGCWVGSVRKEELNPRSYNMRRAGVDASFFPMRAPAPRPGMTEPAYDFIASFELDKSAQTGLIQQAYHSKQATSLSSKFADPESHVFCIDHTLFRPASDLSDSLELNDHPAFEEHGSALHFLPEMQDTALDVAAFALGHRGTFIAVDISEVALKARCDPKDKLCPILRLQPFMDAVDRARHLAVKSVGKSREQRHNVRALSVLVTTDVVDIGFRGEIAAAGWTLVDYDDLEMKQRFGQWMPQMLDPVIHSKAVAFVGTKGSTQSLLSGLRVKKWRGGSADLV